MTGRAARASGGKKGATKAKRKGSSQRKIESLEHPSRRRVSIPTEQTERDIDHGGRDYSPHVRPSVEPYLYWNRQRTEPGREYAHAFTYAKSSARRT